MAVEPPVLEYGAPVRWHRRKWVRRAIIFMLLFIGVPLLVHHQRHRIAEFPDRWRQSGRISKCLDDAPAPGTVAYDDDGARSVSLIAAADEYVPLAGDDRSSSISSASRPSLTWSKPVADRAARSPLYYRELALNLGSNWNWSKRQPVLFMHARKAPGESKRLLVVSGDISWKDPFGAISTRVNLVSQIYHNDGWGRAVVAAGEWHGPYIEHNITNRSLPRLRIFAGQPDPDDDSHFTIEYELDGKRGVIDGWLRAARGNASESVELQIRP